jgi:hypothetical protein
VSLSVVCFRYVDARLDATLDEVNRPIVIALQESNVALVLGRVSKGPYVADISHRSPREDFELLAREVARLGRELVESARTTPDSTAP